MSAGSIAGAAVDLTKYILGTNTSQDSNTTTSLNGNTSGMTSTHVSTSTVDEIQKWIDELTTTDSNTASTSKTTTSQNVATDMTTQNSSDPQVVQMMKDLAQQEINNSNDPSKTQGLLSGIIQTAGDAIKGIFGQQKVAGVYNSSSTAALTNDTISRASADAASAILGYETQEQSLAGTLLNQVGGLTSSSTTKGNVTTTGETDNFSTSATHSTVANTGEDISFEQNNSAADTRVNTDSKTSGQQQSQTSSSGKSGLSVVCTWMYEKEMLSKREYQCITVDFLRKPLCQRQAYALVAGFLVRWLKHTDGKGLLSRAIVALFFARTMYVITKKWPLAFPTLPDPKWTGKLALQIVWLACLLPGLWFWARSKNFGFTLLGKMRAA